MRFVTVFLWDRVSKTITASFLTIHRHPAIQYYINETYTSESGSYITSDGQSASLSWNKAPTWGLWPDLYYCQTVTGLLMWATFSEERAGLLFTIPPGPCQTFTFGSDCHGTCEHILLSQVRDFPFCRLLRLPGLWWRYSTPPPHGRKHTCESVGEFYLPWPLLYI
jgi:hypothetical protein